MNSLLQFLLGQIDKNIILTTIPLCIVSIKKHVQKSWTVGAIWHYTFFHLIFIQFLSVDWPRDMVFLSLPINHKSSSQDKWHQSHSMFQCSAILFSWEWIIHKKETKSKTKKEWPAALTFQEILTQLLWYSNTRGQSLNSAWKEL